MLLMMTMFCSMVISRKNLTLRIMTRHEIKISATALTVSVWRNVCQAAREVGAWCERQQETRRTFPAGYACFHTPCIPVSAASVAQSVNSCFTSSFGTRYWVDGIFLYTLLVLLRISKLKCGFSPESIRHQNLGFCGRKWRFWGRLFAKFT